VKIVIYGKEWQFEETMTVREAMQKLGICPQIAVAIRNGQVLQSDDTIGGDDVVHMIDMIAGG